MSMCEGGHMTALMWLAVRGQPWGLVITVYLALKEGPCLFWCLPDQVACQQILCFTLPSCNRRGCGWVLLIGLIRILGIQTHVLTLNQGPHNPLSQPGISSLVCGQ